MGTAWRSRASRLTSFLDRVEDSMTVRAAAPCSSSSADVSITQRPHRVLVVDDEPAEREGLVQLIGRMGYEAEAADTGERALELVEKFHPAVVVTDFVLPGMDGLELLHQLKGLAQPPTVLLVTGHATIEAAVEAMRRGAYDFITKPLDAVRLEVLIQKAAAHGALTNEVRLLRHRLRQKGS